MISRKMGRVLSAVGAVMLVAGLFLTWYHVERPQGATDTTGWQTFTRLRVAILGGAVLLLLSALVRQVRAVLIARTVLGVVLGGLILRRIIQPPDLVADVSAQLGVAVGLAGAIAGALGGLVDSGREVVERYPDLAGFGRAPGGLLERGGDEQHATLVEPSPPPRGGAGRAHVDSTADEVRA